MSEARTKPNESAGVIPAIKDHNDQIIYGSDGLTKREHFASLAMQALIPIFAEQVHELTNTASAAVEYADALIEALNKPEAEGK